MRVGNVKVNKLNKVAISCWPWSMLDTNLLLVMVLDRYPIVNSNPKAPESN
jgi:hypothetical protein